MYIRHLILMILIFTAVDRSALADEIADLSFKPFVSCKKPPAAPSKKLLMKTYKTYFVIYGWEIYDINGDGWCDWVQGGNEGHRSDQDDPPMREFIYLGTAKGWRRFDQPKVKIDEVIKWGAGKIASISGDDSVNNFVQPIPVYSKGKTKPYIAIVYRWDGQAPPPDRERIFVHQWDDKSDKLRTVPEKEREMVLDFLHDKLCKDHPELTFLGEPFLLARGDLCFPRK